jgi:hypothetical protein
VKVITDGSFWRKVVRQYKPLATSLCLISVSSGLTRAGVGGIGKIKFAYFSVNIHRLSRFYTRVPKVPIITVFAEWDKTTHDKRKQFNLKNVKFDSVSEYH